VKENTRKKLLGVIYFLVKFSLLAIPLYLLIFANFSMPALQNLVAYLSYSILNAFGIQTKLNQSSLTVVSGFKISVIEISMDCTGWKSAYALLALVIATPAIKIRKKFKFLLVSLPVLFLINILRIVSVIYLSLSLEPKYFGLVHDILWQWGLIIAVLSIWAIWLKYEKRI